MGVVNKMASLSYSVGIPSKERAGNVPHMLSMFPGATFSVDKAEEKDYRNVVESNGGKLILHDGLVGQQKILNHILDNLKDDYVLLCDDDLACVRSMVCTYDNGGGQRTEL